MPDVFPYAANKTRSLTLTKEVYQSTPYSGEPKILARGTDRRGFSLLFTNRRQTEYDAAEAFIIAHPIPTHIIFRDYRYYPARDFECWIVPNTFREQGSEVSFRFTYSFDVVQVDV
jgi:hypothetical protein